MDLLSRILECKTDEEADIIITEELEKIQNIVNPLEQLGFIRLCIPVGVYKVDGSLIAYYL